MTAFQILQIADIDTALLVGYSWLEIDVTDYVNAHYGEIFTFAIFSEGTADGNGNFNICSREFSGSEPQLVITFGEGSAQEPNDPEDTTTEPDDTTTESEDTTREPEDTTTAPEDTTTEPEEPVDCVHSYIESIEVPVKVLTNGLKMKVCELCGELTTEEIPATKKIKILAIGNSFSDDAMEYLWDIFNDGGVEEITLGRLYIGSASLEDHYNNITEDNSSYRYYKNTDGEWSYENDTSIKTALEEEEWDVITLQQASGSSGVQDSYYCLEELIDELELLEPNADIFWHMTWAYQQDSTHSAFPNYNSDQLTMYSAIISTVKKAVEKADVLGIIPVGTAIQNIRTSYVGDTVTRDGYHMSYDLGRYTAALTWFAFFTGADPATVDWVPSDYEQKVTENLEVIRESVTNALKDPYNTTQSEYSVAPNATEQ